MINENLKKRLANQPTSEYYIVSAHKKDGTKIEVEIRARLSNFAGHSVILGTIIDVSERVKLETALKESEEMYRRLFQSNMDVVLMIDLEGFIIDINQVGEDVSGYKRQELVGQHFSQIVYPEDFSKVEVLFAEVLQGKPIRYEAKGMNKAGGAVDVLVSAMPLYKNGQITGHFAFIKDITHEKQHLQIVQKWAGNRNN